MSFPNEETREVTRLLQNLNEGKSEVVEELIPLVYAELRRLAAHYLKSERVGHTLQPTALVHEAFLKLVEQETNWQNRSHFFGIASRIMRQILIDHARLYMTDKRGNKPVYFSLDDVQIPLQERADSIIVLDEALERLEKFDEKQAKIVEMRFFGGMSNAEIAESLGISERTVAREWQAARLWLYREINRK